MTGVQTCALPIFSIVGMGAVDAIVAGRAGVTDTACHVRKSVPILERLRDDLALSAAKKTTDDLSFTVETVSCLGACGLAPVLTVNDKVYPSMTPDKASALIKELKEEL